MTNAHSETGQMTVCCQNLLLGALSSRSAPSVLVGALFKKIGLFLNKPRIPCFTLHVSQTNCHDSISYFKFDRTFVKPMTKHNTEACKQGNKDGSKIR
jgi:hypothetical protein